LFCGAGDVAPPADLPSGMEVPARFDDVPDGVLFGVPAVLEHKLISFRNRLDQFAIMFFFLIRQILRKFQLLFLPNFIKYIYNMNKNLSGQVCRMKKDFWKCWWRLY
jgi:hypothetical protein